MAHVTIYIYFMGDNHINLINKYILVGDAYIIAQKRLPCSLNILVIYKDTSKKYMLHVGPSWKEEVDLSKLRCHKIHANGLGIAKVI